MEVEEGIEYTIDEVTMQLVRDTGSSSFYGTIRAGIISVDRDKDVVKQNGGDSEDETNENVALPEAH